MAYKLGLSQFAPIFLLSLLSPCQNELRFCHNGPHRMKDTDCPGGFVFKEAISPTCKYYAKDGNHSGVVLSAPTNPCDDTTERAIDNEGDDLNDLNSFGFFAWEEFEANDTIGEFDPENICQDECLPEWEDINTATDEDPLTEEFDESSLSEEDKKFCDKTNKEMFIRMLMDDDEDDPKKSPPTTTELPEISRDPITNAPLPKYISTLGPEPAKPNDGAPAGDFDSAPPGKIREPEQTTSPPLKPPENNIPFPDNEPRPPSPEFLGRRDSSFKSHNREKNMDAGFSLVTTIPYDTSVLNVIKLLAKSMKVVISACAPYVNEAFYEQVLKGMMFVARLVEDKLLDLSIDLYKGVAGILDHCIGKKLQEFSLNGTKCGGNEKVEGVFFIKSKKYWPYRLTARSFRWGVYHPILDATWTTLDIVQSLCFDSFSSNMMLGHVYHMAMEGLFTNKIRMLWRVIPTLKNENFWNNLMQTYDLNSTMKNLDACAFGARNSSVFTTPLPRPFLTMEEAMKEPPEPSIPHEPPKGWNKTIVKYWENYERLGGFAQVSQEFGRCFQATDSIEESEDMKEDLRKTC